jgi:putative membrane protein
MQSMSMRMANTTQLDVTTRLAFDRTRVAFDRTIMAWIRTATSLITFGFSIYKFFQIEQGRKPNDRLIGPREFALTMVGIGLACLLLGVVDHRRNMKSLMRQYPEMPQSATDLVALLVAVLGILALLAVVFRQ